MAGQPDRSASQSLDGRRLGCIRRYGISTVEQGAACSEAVRDPTALDKMAGDRLGIRFAVLYPMANERPGHPADIYLPRALPGRHYRQAASPRDPGYVTREGKDI